MDAIALKPTCVKSSVSGVTNEVPNGRPEEQMIVIAGYPMSMTWLKHATNYNSTVKRKTATR